MASKWAWDDSGCRPSEAGVVGSVLCAVWMGLSALQGTPETQAVSQVLDDWHLAAAQADGSRYFGHLAEDAVFLGTDGTERWSKPAFEAFAQPFFAKGRAWRFRATRRTVQLLAKGQVAVIEEDLDTPNLGPARGSGVLEKRKGTWKIVQYNLSVPIPNALMADIKQRIAASRSGQ